MNDYQRIAIVGSPGSGKSTLARKLGAITSLPVIHLDMEFWRPNWEMTPQDEWIQRQTKLMQTPQWIIDGNYGSTMEIRFAAADLVIFLDIGRAKCLSRVFKRLKMKRPDFPDFLKQKLDKEFFALCKFIWDYRKVSRVSVLQLHRQYSDKPFITIHNNRELRHILEEFGEIY